MKSMKLRHVILFLLIVIHFKPVPLVVFETPAAVACGEIPPNTISRDSHSGILFMTDSSDSTKITNPNDSNVKIWRACWE